MSKKEKLFRRILDKPKDLRFEELVNVLQTIGFMLDHTTGSHAFYKRTGSSILTIPRKSPIKSYIIDQILDAIGDELESSLDD